MGTTRAAALSRYRVSANLWPNEEQLLLLEAALLPGERGIAAFREWRVRCAPEGEFGWNVFRLLPLVYRSMQEQGVRDPLLARLKGAYRRSWCETHRLFHSAAPAVARLAEAGEVLILKGVPLVLSYYRNHGLRPMADVDLAVRPDRLAEAIRALTASGYRGYCPVSADLLRFGHAAQFVHEDGGQIDLHWHVLFEAGTDAGDRAFWSATEPADFLDTPVLQPDPTSLLLQVILHGLRWNLEPPIRWIADAMFILRERGGAIDWERLVRDAQAHKLSYRLALGLTYLAERFDAPIPLRILGKLGGSPSLVERIENTVMLSDNRRLGKSALGSQWVSFTEYCRYAEAGGALAFLRGYTEFLRFRWGLSGRREIVPTIARGLGRKARKLIRSRAAR